MTGMNLHIYPAPIVHESRIFKQTLAVVESQLFDGVIICGTAKAQLPRVQAMEPKRVIERVGPFASPRKHSVFARVWEQLRWSWAVYRHYASNDKITLINAHSVAVLPVSYFLSRRIGAKLIYDTHELETETLFSRGVQKGIFKAVERIFIDKCDAIFVVNDSIANWYRTHYAGLNPVVVRNVPGSKIDSDIVDMRKLLGVGAGNRLFIHVGNLTHGRNIEAILNAFTSPDVQDHIVFLGAGELEARVRFIADSSANVHHLAAVPPEQVLSYVAGCDAALCLIEPVSLSLQLALPNKAFEYAAVGVPFFYTDLVEVDNLLGPGFQFWRLPDPARDLVSALCELNDDHLVEARRLLSGLNIPSWEHESQAMLAAYAQLSLDGRTST